ncbi:MAG TPA: SDR family NAD(P)-dependent oxidoreductase [Anaerovoracaceae bacterium]|nr:SDR family NAD(P)-dependent oxidoreductase [Anaerovoracaceae bacterium]
MSNLNGKYAVVTGGGKGIGESIVKRFVDDGAAGVAILGRNFDTLKKTAELIDPEGKIILPVKCDVSDEGQVADAIKAILDKFQTIDILVNNAGITKDSMFHKMTKEQWDAVININLYGTYHMCKYVVPVMREKNYGRIVNITSISASGNIGQANYSATKGAIVSFTNTLALEGGPKNITANCVAPGFIKTEMYDAVPEEIIAQHVKRIPLKRLGEPEEIAGAVSFLASDDASFISGQCLTISGGGSI